MLSADKGAVRLDEAMAPAPPEVVVHGSVSMTVNYHALGMWAVAHGGAWLHAEQGGNTLSVCGLVLDLDDRRATLATFDRAIAQRHPDDLHALKRVLVARAGELELGELMAYVRLSGHDAKVFLDCAPAIHAALDRAGAGADARRDLALAIARVWDGYLPIGEDRDLPALLAQLSASLGRDVEAARFRMWSRRLHGGGGLVAPAPAVEDPFDVITGSRAGQVP